MTSSFKKRLLRRLVYEQLDASARVKRGLSPTNIVIVVAILVALICAILETEPTIAIPWANAFETIERVLTGLFVLEYAARLWSAADRAGPGTGVQKRFRFVISIAALLDLLVILAALAPFVSANLAVLRFARIARLLRLAKLGRFGRAAQHLHYAIASRRYELALAMSFAGVLLIAGASALYWAEGAIQPEKFGSIPRALWWAVVTMTTVGYGDVAPLTPLGKFLAALVAIASIGLVALPTGILASGFSDAVQRERRDEKY